MLQFIKDNLLAIVIILFLVIVIGMTWFKKETLEFFQVPVNQNLPSLFN